MNPIAQYYDMQDASRKADYVIVIFHGGMEHYQFPSPRMQETYRFFIDAGLMLLSITTSIVIMVMRHTKENLFFMAWVTFALIIILKVIPFGMKDIW